MFKKLAFKTAKKMIRATLRSVRKNNIKRDGKVSSAEVIAVAREFLDLVMDEVEPDVPRRGPAREIVNDLRFRFGQLQERVNRP